jgi:hypothetical protein
MSNVAYEVVRSARDSQLHIIFVEGRFSQIPEHDRRLGPWRPLSSGNIADLKPQYRVQIGSAGYVLVRQLASTFSAEPPPPERAAPDSGQEPERAARTQQTRPRAPR